MKRTICILSGLLFFNSFFSQVTNTSSTVFQPCSTFEISKPLKELAELFPLNKNGINIETHNKKFTFKKTNTSALPIGEDPAIQKTNGSTIMSPPISNWDGQSNSGYPPDPTGAAGPNHFFQAVNTSYMVFDKTGNPLMSAPANLKSLWSGSTDEGDPIVLYDKYADRWFVSQFQNDNSILIAISTSADPLGTYYTYSFLPDSIDFPDYPKFSIWPDGYYMTTNYNTQKVVVFDRAKMLTGNSSAGMIIKTLPSMPSSGFFCPLPSDADGQLPPYGTPCYFFCFEDDAWGGSATTDQIRIYKMNTDWTTPSNTTIALDTKLPTQAFNAVLNYDYDIKQKGSQDSLDGLTGIFMFRAQYRVWAGYNSVTLCNVVNANGAGLAGIRWYELRQNNNTKTWTIYQQGTYAPDNQNRWMASIAMDDNGNIGMAYAVSGTATYPSIRYTGRLASDPLNQMTFAEQTAASGNSIQSGINRYGDYSHTSLDPVDGTIFWHTGEYIYGGNPATRIFSFKLTSTSGINEQEAPVTIIATVSGNDLTVKINNLATKKSVLVDLFDINGKLLTGRVTNPLSNSFETNFNTTGLSKGAYFLRVGNTDFQKIKKIILE